MLYCCISRIFRLIAALHYTLSCTTYLKFSVMLKIGKNKQKKRKKVQSLWEGQAGLKLSWLPWTGAGVKASSSFSQFCILSQLHCSFAANKNLCVPLKISSILSTVISLSILSCLSVGAGTIWYWEYRTRADRLQYHVKRSFSSDGSLHFLIWSSCTIFTRLSTRFLTLNSDLQETRQAY